MSSCCFLVASLLLVSLGGLPHGSISVSTRHHKLNITFSTCGLLGKTPRMMWVLEPCPLPQLTHLPTFRATSALLSDLYCLPCDKHTTFVAWQTWLSARRCDTASGKHGQSRPSALEFSNSKPTYRSTKQKGHFWRAFLETATPCLLLLLWLVLFLLQLLLLLLSVPLLFNKLEVCIWILAPYVPVTNNFKQAVSSVNVPIFPDLCWIVQNPLSGAFWLFSSRAILGPK